MILTSAKKIEEITKALESKSGRYRVLGKTHDELGEWYWIVDDLEHWTTNHVLESQADWEQYRYYSDDTAKTIKSV